jgi:hypothetical protein
VEKTRRLVVVVVVAVIVGIEDDESTGATEIIEGGSGNHDTRI